MKDVLVNDVMTHLVVTLRPDDPVHEAAARLARNGISGAPVVESGKVVGIVSESDIIRAAAPPGRAPARLGALTMIERSRHDAGAATAVSDVMSTNVVTVSRDASIWTAASLLERRGIKRLPVVDGEGYLIGIVSRADLVRVMGRSDRDIRDGVLDAVRVLREDALGDVDARVRDGLVVLTGKVANRSAARMAVELTARVVGVVGVEERLAVERDDAYSATG